jgi:hypothetical protein
MIAGTKPAAMRFLALIKANIAPAATPPNTTEIAMDENAAAKNASIAISHLPISRIHRFSFNST